MNHDLTIAVLAGLGAMLGWGLADFFAKKTIDVIGSIASLVWAHLFGLTFFIGITLIQFTTNKSDLSFPHSFPIYLGLMFFGTLQMIIYWLVYEGFGKGQLALLNPVFASFPGIVAIVSIIWFGEVLSPQLGIALIALFGGIIILNIDLESLKAKKINVVPGLKEVALAALLAAFWTIMWDKFITGHDPISYALLMYAFMSLAAFVIAKLLKTKLRINRRDMWKFLVLIGGGETIAYLSISWGYSRSPLTSVIALISGAFSLPTIVLAYFFLKERITKLQTIAICIIILGILLVSTN